MQKHYKNNGPVLGRICNMPYNNNRERIYLKQLIRRNEMSRINVYAVLEEANEVNCKAEDIWGVVRQDTKEWLMYGNLEQMEDWLLDNTSTYAEVRA
jgi:hypothetical protein